MEYKKVGTACSWLLAAVGELLAYKRGLKNTVGTYYGSKDRRFIGHWAESCHAFAMSHLRVLKRPSHAK